VHLWIDVEAPPSEVLVAGATLEPSPTPSPPPPPPPSTPVLTPGPSGGLIYHVEPGDTLIGVAERFQVDPWAVATANGMSELGPIPADEDIIIPGITYTVQVGDSLASIAAAFGVSPAVLMEANGIADASMIYAGQEVVIPGASP
jgi:LysM repeat protein